MLSALLMMRRLAAALRVALREEDFAPEDVECPRSEAHGHRSLAENLHGGIRVIGIGILVEVARRLGMGFIAARAEPDEANERRAGSGDVRG